MGLLAHRRGFVCMHVAPAEAPGRRRCPLRAGECNGCAAIAFLPEFAFLPELSFLSTACGEHTRCALPGRRHTHTHKRARAHLTAHTSKRKIKIFKHGRVGEGADRAMSEYVCTTQTHTRRYAEEFLAIATAKKQVSLYLSIGGVVWACDNQGYVFEHDAHSAPHLCSFSVLLPPQLRQGSEWQTSLSAGERTVGWRDSQHGYSPTEVAIPRVSPFRLAMTPFDMWPMPNRTLPVHTAPAQLNEREWRWSDLQQGKLDKAQTDRCPPLRHVTPKANPSTSRVTSLQFESSCPHLRVCACVFTRCWICNTQIPVSSLHICGVSLPISRCTVDLREQGYAVLACAQTTRIACVFYLISSGVSGRLEAEEMQLIQCSLVPSSSAAAGEGEIRCRREQEEQLWWAEENRASVEGAALLNASHGPSSLSPLDVR